MAISKTIEFKGIEIANCYIRVEEFHGSKSLIDGVVSFRANDKAELLFVERFKCVKYSPDGDNPLTSIYKHIKGLPRFTGASDC